MQKTNTSSAARNTSDLPDSPKDKREMEEQEVILDLPDVSDIPGQENIRPLPMGEMADQTISSSDEEGDDLFDDDIDEDIDNDPDSNVSKQEKEDLEETANDMPTDDDLNLRRAALDNTDDDGAPLNEGSFKKNITGDDLDVPGADADDADEETGDEDEENNDYSLSDDDTDGHAPEDNY
jgi:hypothetical protein